MHDAFWSICKATDSQGLMNVVAAYFLDLLPFQPKPAGPACDLFSPVSVINALRTLHNSEMPPNKPPKYSGMPPRNPQGIQTRRLAMPAIIQRATRKSPEIFWERRQINAATHLNLARK